MELNLKNQFFIIGGATSGLGKAVSETLLAEGANILAVARGREKLMTLKNAFPEQVEMLEADITGKDSVEKLKESISGRQVHGILVNAGGPPAMTVMEATLSDWDNAYKSVLRWKVCLIQALVPGMLQHKYGRILFVESASVKQPMENLVLSNAFRLAVIGFLKTCSQEFSANGITFNALAPGYHDTAALNRIINKKTGQAGINKEQVINQFISDTKVGSLGSAEDFASLAVWLLSANSRYITGQTISMDGGLIKGVMG